MKILSTAALLGATLLAVPVFTYFFGTPLGNLEMEALQTLAWVTGGVMLYCFIVGEITGNTSQVDKLWSIVPIIYVWIVADYSHYHPRLVVMAVLVTLWGARLTANFAMKGAYSWKFWAGEEDYRWKILREKPEFQPRWKWTLFNLFFISTYQNILILLFTLPAIIALQNTEIPLGGWDYLIAGIMFFWICFEAVADIQQWNYQKDKWDAISKGGELTEDQKRGFQNKGLWSKSRHPNYLAEQSIWISFYFFSVIASGQWINWSVMGAILLMLLFMGSSQFSEEISASKYPEYTDYQQKTPRFIPKIFG